MDACIRSALLLDILYDINDLKIRKKLIDTLENWFTANNLFEKLPAPVPIVKQWEKTECRRVKDVDERVDSPTLYCLLSSSTELSKRNIGTILEQELTAYEEMSFKYPELCQKMQMKIKNILLQDIFITPDITIDEVQKAALELISNVPVPGHSTFLVGYLYRDLCQRLIANGQLIEEPDDDMDDGHLLGDLEVDEDLS